MYLLLFEFVRLKVQICALCKISMMILLLRAHIYVCEDLYVRDYSLLASLFSPFFLEYSPFYTRQLSLPAWAVLPTARPMLSHQPSSCILCQPNTSHSQPIFLVGLITASHSHYPVYDYEHLLNTENILSPFQII